MDTQEFQADHDAADGSPVASPRGSNVLIRELGRLLITPLLILGALIAALALLGLSQQMGWIQMTQDHNHTTATASDATTYICPMMCVPPTSQPGRCPVCAMELVPAASSVSTQPSEMIQLDPRARRVAGIQTVPARLERLEKQIEGVGEIRYDEGKLKTLAAWSDGRIEDLYADYTGIEVNQGDILAHLYSPDLYSAQVEFVRTVEFMNRTQSGESVRNANQSLLESARQRLLELGLTQAQVNELRSTLKPERRIDLMAPISGTVIEKLAVTGQYVQAGSPIYRLADLDTVWLVLEVFPEEAHLIREGQEVMAQTQSMTTEASRGVVEFIEPIVDPMTRTVGVRIAIENHDRRLKPGEYARATLKVPVIQKDGVTQQVVTVPRNSLLTIDHVSLMYVEQEPGEFYLRRVLTGPVVDGWVAVYEGIQAGENVVARSTFLLDAQMQLQGNPSLIDPDKAVAKVGLSDAEKQEIEDAMQPLSLADRELALAQEICPVQEIALGSMGMGTPIKVDVQGKPIFICCEGCRRRLVSDPDKYQQILTDYHSKSPADRTSSSDPTRETQQENNPLPQMELPQIELPQMEVPQMEVPQMEVPGEEAGDDGTTGDSLPAESDSPADNRSNESLPQMAPPSQTGNATS